MTRLTAEEVFAEVEWLRDGGVHPAQIAVQLGKTCSGLERLARNHDRPDIAALFYAEALRSRAEWLTGYKRLKRAS